MPASTSINLLGMERPLRILAASNGKTQSAYLRDIVKAAIEREAAKSAALAELLGVAA